MSDEKTEWDCVTIRKRRTRGEDVTPICSLSDFIRDVECKTIPEGFRVSCKLGFWSVEGPELQRALTEGMHYYQQYHADGEYSKEDSE